MDYSRALLPSVLIPTAYLYICPTELPTTFGNAERYGTYPGALELSCIAVFWLLVGIGQWWAIRRWLPHAAVWCIVTCLGGILATGVYHIGGRLLVPLWAYLFGVAPKPAGIALFLMGTNGLHQTLFFALQGALFGMVLGTVQSLLAPLRWSHKVAFVALSVFAGAVALGLVWLAHSSAISYLQLPNRFFGIILRAIGVTKLVPPLAWIVYSVITGLCIGTLLMRTSEAKEASVASRFD